MSNVLPLADQVNLPPQAFKILRSTPFMDKANGPFMREQPLGLVTREVANSFKTKLKWPSRSPMWFIAKGTKRLVELF